MISMTAVEIFFKDLVHLGYIEYPDENLVQDRLKLALELEKQQIIDAYDHYRCVGNFDSGIEYYNEIHKKP